MNKAVDLLKKKPNTLFCILGAVLFMAAFYFVSFRTPLSDVWLPGFMNNDEAMYNRQVVSVVTHGGPQGYFGYNESHADIGRYSTWGPFLIWAYSLPALLFGDTSSTVLWCNLIFLVAGIAFFARSARLNVWQCIVLCGGLFAISIPLHSSINGSSEGLHYAMVLALMGCMAGLARSEKTGGGYLVLAEILCVLETIYRPYALLFWVFPLTVVWQDKRRRGITLGVAAAGFAVALFSMSKLSAPYFSGSGMGMDFAGLQLLAGGHGIQAVVYEWQRAVKLLIPAWSDILQTLRGDTTYIGGACVVFLTITAITVGCLVWDKKHGKAAPLKGGALFCSAAIALVLLGMYNIDPRHLMMVVLLQLAAIVVEDAAPAAVYLPLMLLLLVPVTFERSSFPEKNESMAAQMVEVEEALAGSIEARGSKDPWDHTLAYAYADNVFHGYLYALPAGMGIEFDMNTYIADASQPIYARYAMVNHGSGTEERLVNDGWQVLLSTEDLVLYERM